MERKTADEVEALLYGASWVQNNPDGSVVYRNGAGVLIVVKATIDGNYVVKYVRGGCGSCAPRRR